MQIEYKACPWCHQSSSVAQGKCYACGASVPETLQEAKDESGTGENPPVPAASPQETVTVRKRKLPVRVIWGRFFLVTGMAMMLFFGFIFNSKYIYMKAFGQAVDSIGNEFKIPSFNQPLKRPSSEEPDWFLDPGQLEENGMRLGMVFWISGMLCILLPAQKQN